MMTDTVDHLGTLMTIVDEALANAEAEGDRVVIFRYRNKTHAYSHARAANLIQALHVRITRPHRSR
jgi:hypothetical protein